MAAAGLEVHSSRADGDVGAFFSVASRHISMVSMTCSVLLCRSAYA